jgi:hypothetical protein
MRAICKANSGEFLSNELLRLGHTDKSIFSVSVDKEYEVFAMSLWRGAILILLADEHHLPNWFPMELFSLSAPCLPSDWSFVHSPTNKDGLQALWGYERLIIDVSHYEDLIERDPEALRHFYKEERLRLQHD